MPESRRRNCVREYRILVELEPRHLAAFREDLVALAGAFTEIGSGPVLRYVVGLRGRYAKAHVLAVLARWRDRATRLTLEDPATSPDAEEIYFLLPLQRNPDPAGGKRSPLFTNEELADLRLHLARKFHFRPEMVRVYGEWRNKAGDLVPDHSFLIRVPRRSRGTVPALRRFMRRQILASPSCDQDCLYLSARWWGELVYPQ